MRPLTQLLETAAAGDADDRHVEMPAADHRLQRREDFLEREVAGDAEEDQRVGSHGAHVVLLDVAAEGEAHRRQQAVLEIGLAAGGEAGEQRGGEDVGRHAFLDRRFDRPASFARIRDAAGECRQVGTLAERGSGQIEQPRRHHAAVTPHFGDRRQIEIELVVLRVAQRRVLGGRLRFASCRRWRA